MVPISSVPRFRCAGVCVFLAVLLIHVSASAVSDNRCFDMGGVGSLLREGHVRVTKDDLYEEQKGYGWLKPPNEEVTVKTDPTADEVTRDGVVASREMEFRADIPSGAYFAEVVIGKSSEKDAETRVYVDSVVTAKSGRFVDAHAGRPRRTLRFPITVRGDAVVIRVSSSSGPVELNAIAFKVPPHTPLKVKDGKLVSEIPAGFRGFTRGNNMFSVGEYEMAAKQFGYIQDDLLRAYCFLGIGGRLAAPNAKVSVRKAANVLMQYAAPENEPLANRVELVQKYLLALYYYDLGAWSYAQERTGLSVWQRFSIAADLMAQIAADPDDPLYHQALWHLGRIWYWMWREQGGGYQRREADGVFDLLAEDYPDFDLLSMYRGKKIVHSTDYSAGAEGAPSWAVAQREALGRLMEVIDYWASVQNENGEFGGGYGDDCEIFRWWPVAVFAADDEIARRTISRLAEGIWDSGIIENGYSAALEDVEHSAEPTSDTLPLMIGMNYGNPVYIERCMETAKCMRDVWTGVNARGHLHFKSAWLSATRCAEDKPYGVDVPMNARAAKPGLWLCWYNNNPALIKLFADWGRSWVEDAERTGKGKPEGVVPAAVSFADDAIGGYSDNWYHPNLYWDYYNWESGATNQICDQLLATYDLTDDDRLLYPVEKGLEMARDFWMNPVRRPQEGSAVWAAKVLHETGLARYGCQLRTLRRSTRFDDYLEEHGTAYAKFLLTGSKSFLTAACQDSINSTKYNFPLLTTEVKFTDRVAVRGADELLSMYTGGCGPGIEYPYYAVTWSRTDRNFAALVTSARPNLLKVIVYDFHPLDRDVTMTLWRLQPGIYRMRVGPDMDDDGEHDLNFTEKTIRITERGTPVDVRLAGRKQILVEISQTEKGRPRERELPDLALTEADVMVPSVEPRVGEEAAIRVAVHNIGSARAEKLVVALLEAGDRLDEQVVAILEPPNDLEPKIAQVALRWKPEVARTYRLTVAIDPDNAVKEIYKLNNTVDFEMRAAQ